MTEVTEKPGTKDLLGVFIVLLKKNISEVTLACSPWCSAVPGDASLSCWNI